MSRLAIVLVLCLIAIGLPGVPVQAVCAPYEIELSPYSGVPGTEVTLYGHGFAAGKLVDVYYDGGLVTTNRTDSAGDFAVTFTIPEGIGGRYQVLVDVGYAKVDTYFTVNPGLIISPKQGPVGTNVTVAGKGFAKNEQGIELRYYLDDSYDIVKRRIVADSKGSWTTTFAIPPSARGEHKLDAQGAVTRLYEVQGATFRLTAEIDLDRSSGIVGDNITMTGVRFMTSEKIRIFFDGDAVATGIKASSKGDWEATFMVPEMPAGIHSVTVEGEWTRKEDMSAFAFEIKPDIALSSEEGYVGMNLTVTGRGFAADEDLVITYDARQVATTETDDKGSFDSTFPVPASQHGERPVAVGHAGGNYSSAVFVLESAPPPVPALISPAAGSRVGFVNKAAVTFAWSAVSDDSGVRYRLQVASNADVAAGGFVEPLISQEGLVQTHYTLNSTEALPYGSYYWIVQAVDGAENESGWSRASSLRVGILPKWGFIAIIVAAVVGVGVLIRALVLRRRRYYC